LATPGRTQPPAAAVFGTALGHEAQVVGLFAHLRDEGDADGQRGAEQRHREGAAAAAFAGVAEQAAEHFRLLDEQEGVGQDQQRQPQRLRPRLQSADGGDAVRDEGNHRQRADQVAPGRRNIERQLERVGHDRRFEREENEGE